MIRRLLRLAILGVPVAFALDGWLAARRGTRPPQPVRSLVVIDASIERTWELLADIPRQPEWMHDMKRVQVFTPGPTRVGTRGVATVRVFGISVSDPVEVTMFDPPTTFAIRHEGLFTGGGVITLESGGDGTTTIVRWDETLIPPLLPDVGALVLAPVLRPVFQADLHRLRRLLETGSADG